MAVYKNANTSSPVTAVEFKQVPNGNLAHVRVKDASKIDEIKQWLTSPEIGQRIIAQTAMPDETILITRGPKSKDEMMQAFAARGDPLKVYEHKAPFSERAWQTGAKLAFVGQFMQLGSAFLRPNRKIDWPLFGLAVPNLLATSWIMAYGAQRSEDTHRLKHIKTETNATLENHIPAGAALPPIDDKRTELRKDEKKPPTAGDRFDGFMKRNSVWLGEIVMRYAGAASLAFNMKNWPKAFKELLAGNVKEAYEIGKTVTPNANKLTGPHLTHYAGLASLTGKTIALASKGPDDYNPKPKTWTDNVRENITFRLGGWIETAAFGAVAADAFINKKISWKPAAKGGKAIPDFISGIGGTLFTIRYAIRHWAPFGIKEMDMDEAFAHATDSLAKVEPGKRAQAVADIAAKFTDHFKDKRLNFSDVFDRMVNETYKYHHIALEGLDINPANPTTAIAGQTQPPAAAETVSIPIEQGKRAMAFAPASASHLARAGKTPNDAPDTIPFERSKNIRTQKESGLSGFSRQAG